MQEEKASELDVCCFGGQTFYLEPSIKVPEMLEKDPQGANNHHHCILGRCMDQLLTMFEDVRW
jgi:hypothetical protein